MNTPGIAIASALQVARNRRLQIGRDRDLGSRPAKQKSLRKVHVGLNRENQLLCRFNTLDHHQHPRLMQQRNQLRQNRLLSAVTRRANQLAVELHEIRPDAQ